MSAIFSSYCEDLDNYKDQKTISSVNDIAVKDNELPNCLKEGQYDVVCVSCKEDEQNVAVVQHILEKFVTLDGGENVEISTVDTDSGGSEWIRSKFSSVDEAVTRSTFIFIFMSEIFVRDEFGKLMKDECLLRSIKDPTKQWCLIPIYMRPKSECSFKVPWGLGSLKPVYVNKVLKGKSLNHLNLSDMRKGDVDPLFLKNMGALLNSKLSMKLDRKAHQALEVQKFIKKVELQRKMKLMQYETDQKLRNLREIKELSLQEEKQKSRLQEGMKTIEAMDETALVYNLNCDTQEETGIRNKDADLINLVNVLCKETGIPAEKAFHLATQLSEQSQTTPSHSNKPCAIPTQTIVNINNSSGIMVGERNIQHSQIQAQNPQEEDTCKDQESLEDGSFEIERTNGGSEGRDDKPQETESQHKTMTSVVKPRQPVENMDRITASPVQLRTGLSPDVKEIRYSSPLSPSGKPVAAIPPILQDNKTSRATAEPDPDQTRVKVVSRRIAGNLQNLRVPTQHTSDSQALSESEDTQVKYASASEQDDTEVKQEYQDEDETTLKGIAFDREYIASTQRVTMPLDDETVLKQGFQEYDDDSTLLKRTYASTEQEDTIVKVSSSGDIDMTHTKGTEATSLLEETKVKTVDEESAQGGTDELGWMNHPDFIREFGSSVDPYHFGHPPVSGRRTTGGQEGSSISSGSSTLVPSVSSAASNTTLTPYS